MGGWTRGLGLAAVCRHASPRFPARPRTDHLSEDRRRHSRCHVQGLRARHGSVLRWLEREGRQSDALLPGRRRSGGSDVGDRNLDDTVDRLAVTALRHELRLLRYRSLERRPLRVELPEPGARRGVERMEKPATAVAASGGWRRRRKRGGHLPRLRREATVHASGYAVGVAAAEPASGAGGARLPRLVARSLKSRSKSLG